jgi:RNA polymerase sigma factor (sigma-70 family)
VEALHRHYPFLRSVARRHLAAGATDLEPDDVVQDVVVRVLRRWTLLRFDDDRALAGYLHRAVVNRARDARRLAPRWTGADLDLLQSRRPTALEGLLADEWRRRAKVAVRQLRDGDRRVVVGRVMASLSFGELARRTGHPSADAARKATTRALGRLRQRLAG